jgi:DNA-binding MarR family transcriptional regulator
MTDQAGITEQVLISLRRIIRAIDLHSRVLVDRYGLTGPQVAVLRALNDLGTVSVGELAKAASLSAATVTGIVERLEKHGLVYRNKSDSDKRRVLVSLTSKGENTLPKTIPPLQEHFTNEFNKLEDWEQTQILSSLQRVVYMMEAQAIQSSPILSRETPSDNSQDDGLLAFPSTKPKNEYPDSTDKTSRKKSLN